MSSVKDIHPESTLYPVTMKKAQYISILEKFSFDFKMMSKSEKQNFSKAQLREKLFQLVSAESDSESESDDEVDEIWRDRDSESEEEEEKPPAESFPEAAKRIVSESNKLSTKAERVEFIGRQLAALPIEYRTKFFALMKTAAAGKTSAP